MDCPFRVRRRGCAFLLAPLTLLGQAKRVSVDTPFPANCIGAQSGTNFRSATSEPWLAVNPANPQHLVGVWQQDRWSNGGSSGVVSAVSMDGGQTWTRSVPKFTICSGGTAQNGGAFERATDPWVSFARDGTIYQIAYAFNFTSLNQAMLVSKSSDNGFTWSDPVVLARETTPGFVIDKETLTNDPGDAKLAYAVWDRLEGLNQTNPDKYRGPTWFTRTTDGGASWSEPKILYDPGPNAQTIGNIIFVLPDGALANLATRIENVAADDIRDSKVSLVALRSEDKGLSWSEPFVVAAMQPIGVANVKTRRPVRTGFVLFNAAMDPVSGSLYAAWEDARFSNGQREGIAFAKSSDGGKTWSTPVQVNRATEVQAFTPVVAVGAQGAVAVSYCDFRKDTPDGPGLLTNYWRVTSSDGGETWSESALAGPFDLTKAPAGASGQFLGDYQGLVAYGDTFAAFFVAPGLSAAGATQDRTEVYWLVGDGPGDTTANAHMEINRVKARVRKPGEPRQIKKK